MLRIVSILLFAISCSGPLSERVENVPASPLNIADSPMPAAAPARPKPRVPPHNSESVIQDGKHQRINSDRQARAVVFQSVSLLRALGRVMTAHRDDCAAMAVSLMRWRARHGARLEQHAQRASTIPAATRARMMARMMEGDTQVADGMSALQACMHDERVVDAVNRLQMTPSSPSSSSEP